jgi:PTH1 family peptidyl-tRNA hydrolase
VVDRIAEDLGLRWRKQFLRPFEYCSHHIEEEKLFLSKPLSYMNRSGEALHAVLRKSRVSLEDVLVVCDTLDLPPGVCRLKRKGGSAGHNGLKSILRYAETDEIMRLYIGIGRPSTKSDVVRYVLEEPREEEEPLYDSAIGQAAHAIEQLPTTPITQVMNELNKRD